MKHTEEQINNKKRRNIIELENIVKIFRVKTEDILVLKKINLNIDEGDFAIVFGPSGCGKSTMLHIMLGLESPTSGTARFSDYNLYEMTEDGRSQFRKNNIGMVYQQPNWIKSLTVIENVLFATSLVGIDKSKAREMAIRALEKVGMQEWKDYYPTELSSGQQQKVSLARAIVTDPKIIIADEPSGNLDYQSGIELMRLFSALKEQGKTIIMVTHDINNVDYANKVVQVFDGQIVDIHTVTANNVSTIKKNLLRKETFTAALEKNAELDSKLLYENRKRVVNEVPKRRQFTIPIISPIISLFRERKSLNIRRKLYGFFKNAREIGEFIILLFLYLLRRGIESIQKRRLTPRFFDRYLGRPFDRVYSLLFSKLNNDRINTITRIDLIEISLKNMMSRKARSTITIGGMSIGIATIVFLVSLGYGLERLVISRVARLEEMKQIDATPAVASNVRITDKTIADIGNLNKVEKVLPVIGVVGKVKFNNSSTDVAVYGVLSDYLKESAIQPSRGTIFTSNELAHVIHSTDSSPKKSINERAEGQVAGAKTKSTSPNKKFEKISEINYKINPGVFLRVREKASTSSAVLGYTRRIEGTRDGIAVWGDGYIDSANGQSGITSKGEILGKWIEASVPLWQQTVCSVEEDSECEEGRYLPLKDEDSRQVSETGYFAQIEVVIDNELGQVLGTSTSSRSSGEVKSSTSSASATQSSTNEATDEATLILQELLEPPEKEKLNKIVLSANKERKAVVNTAFLNVLGLDENAIGQKFVVSMIATGSLVGNNQRVESQEIEYEIVGITSQTDSPVVYIPLIDVKELKIDNYSQIKVVTGGQNVVPEIRKQIEVMGLNTSSVIDTVAQIESFFSTARLILSLLGIVALSVAALGMFNTLTISLMERTHEVGMMKAMGMKSDDVKELFLTESMIMGVFGGIGGLFMGFVFGKVLSILLSTISIARGIGFLDITYIPLTFNVLIVLLSLGVGLITGIYPARRATKISALDALRYE